MSILITIRTKIILCRLASARSYLKSGKTLKNMKKITLFIMDVGVLDQRFSLSEYWQGKSLVSRVGTAYNNAVRQRFSRIVEFKL